MSHVFHMYFTITFQVRRCEVCQLNNRKFDKPSPLLHTIPVSDTCKKVGIDLIQLPKSRNGNQYCITLADYFSKWPEVEAIPTKEASHVATFLLKMIFCHGSPEEIISDQDTEFCNQLIDLLEKHKGFKHKVTSAYHPQCNGLDERMNQTFICKLRKHVNEGMDDWEVIYIFVYCYTLVFYLFFFIGNHYSRYDQSKMRSHLIQCFNYSKMECFP